MRVFRTDLERLVELALAHRWRRRTDRFPMCMGRAARDECTCRAGMSPPKAGSIVDAWVLGFISQGEAERFRAVNPDLPSPRRVLKAAGAELDVEDLADVRAALDELQRAGQ